jgi:hypothetical protein
VSAEYRNRLLALARRVREHGPLHPLVVIESADDPALFFDANPFWGNHAQRKRVMYTLGGTVGYGVGAERIYVVVEMWIAEEHFTGTEADVEAMRDRVRRGDVVPPRDRPDRQSAIQVMELSPEETPAGMVLQTFTRRKGKLRWSTPREWKTGDQAEDFTFGEFWRGYTLTAAIRDAVFRDKDTNDGVDQYMRQAARKTAVTRFGAALFEEHEIGRVMRRW